MLEESDASSVSSDASSSSSSSSSSSDVIKMKKEEEKEEEEEIEVDDEKEETGKDEERCSGRFLPHAPHRAQGPRRHNAGAGKRLSPAGKPTGDYRGMSFHKHRGKWAAAFQVDGKKRHVGCYDDARSAARAYDNAALLHLGKEAGILNFNEDGSLNPRRFERRKPLFMPRGGYKKKVKEEEEEEEEEEIGRYRGLLNFGGVGARAIRGGASISGRRGRRGGGGRGGRGRGEGGGGGGVEGSSISNGSRSGSNCINSSDREGGEDSDGDDSSSGSSSSDESDDGRAGPGSSAPVTKAKLNSVYRGVYFDRSKGLWSACIFIGGKTIHVGTFQDEGEAARAHDGKALKLFARPILKVDPVSGERNKECKLGKHLGPLPAALPYLRKRVASSSSYRGVQLKERRNSSYENAFMVLQRVEIEPGGVIAARVAGFVEEMLGLQGSRVVLHLDERDEGRKVDWFLEDVEDGKYYED